MNNSRFHLRVLDAAGGARRTLLEVVLSRSFIGTFNSVANAASPGRHLLLGETQLIVVVSFCRCGMEMVDVGFSLD